jgi:hypothetical protein
LTLGVSFSLISLIDAQESITEIAITSLKDQLTFQHRMYSILNGIGAAVIEIDREENDISYANDSGFKLLQRLFIMLKPNSTLPKILRKNTFLLNHLMS